MGNAVKIYDLACNLIRLYGYLPEKDIAIKIGGLKKGEKIVEENLIQKLWKKLNILKYTKLKKNICPGQFWMNNLPNCFILSIKTKKMCLKR